MCNKESARTCGKTDCERPFYAKDVCKIHYNIMLKDAGRLNPKPCRAADCKRDAWSGGFCSTHYARKRDGRMDVPVRRYNSNGCDTVGCNEPHYGQGMCQAHYRQAPPEDGYAEKNLKRKYGITAAERDALIEAQDGRCAICGKRAPEGKVLNVDHDHSHCGGPRKGCRHCVRGMLCNGCNTQMRWLHETGLADSAAEYLENPPAHAVIGRPEELPVRVKPFEAEIKLLKDLGLR